MTNSATSAFVFKAPRAIAICQRLGIELLSLEFDPISSSYHGAFTSPNRPAPAFFRGHRLPHQQGHPRGPGSLGKGHAAAHAPCRGGAGQSRDHPCRQSLDHCHECPRREVLVLCSC